MHAKPDPEASQGRRIHLMYEFKYCEEELRRERKPSTLHHREYHT